MWMTSSSPILLLRSTLFTPPPPPLPFPKPHHRSSSSSSSSPRSHPAGVVAGCLPSSLPSPAPVEGNDAASAIPVRAYFLGTSVDLQGLMEQNMPNFIQSTSQTINYLVLRFGDLRPYPVLGSCITGSDCCYMVVFHYGSIVLFNAREHEVDDYLKIVKRHASITEMLPEMKRYEYEVREKPDSNKWMEAGLDYLMLQFLNIDGIQTIGSVLGRSIALDYYGRQVDGIVAELTDIKREMEKNGTFSMRKAYLNEDDVVCKLLLLRSDNADAKYPQMWEYLGDEFELTQRFASLVFKLNFVEMEMSVMRRKYLQQQMNKRKGQERKL